MHYTSYFFILFYLFPTPFIPHMYYIYFLQLNNISNPIKLMGKGLKQKVDKRLYRLINMHRKDVQNNSYL